MPTRCKQMGRDFSSVQFRTRHAKCELQKGTRRRTGPVLAQRKARLGQARGLSFQVKAMSTMAAKVQAIMVTMTTAQAASLPHRTLK